MHLYHKGFSEQKPGSGNGDLDTKVYKPVSGRYNLDLLKISELTQTFPNGITTYLKNKENRTQLTCPEKKPSRLTNEILLKQYGC